MKKNIVSFTKLDIVQLKVNGEIRQELPTSIFLERIENAIKSDVSKDQVIVNEEGNYEIYHNGKTYSVCYGDELVNNTNTNIDVITALNNLVSLSDVQKKKQKYDGEQYEISSRNLKEIVEDGDEGIFYSEDDKEKYVEYYKKELSRLSVFKGLSKTFLLSSDTTGVNWDGVVTIFPSLFLGITSMVLWGLTTNWIFAIMALYSVIEFTSLAKTSIENTPLNVILKTFLRVFQFVYRIIKNTFSKIHKKHIVEKIEKTIDRSELSEKMTEVIHQANEVVSTNEKQYVLKDETKKAIKNVFTKITMIADDKVKTDCAKDLDTIIEVYKSIPEEEYNKGFSDLLYQLSFIDGRLSEELRKQISSNQIQSTFDRTNRKIDSISEDVKTNSKTK